MNTSTNDVGTHTGRAKTRQVPPILLALFEAGHPTACLKRAVKLARMLGAQLRVLRVLEASYTTPLFPLVTDRFTEVKRSLEAQRTTRGWLGEVLHDDIAGDDLAVRSGTFVEQVAIYASEIGAELIVVSPSYAALGGTVTSLAHAANTPVLVACAATTSQAIVAATDLEDADDRVIWVAAELGHKLGAPVIAMHNVNPMSAPEATSSDAQWPVTVVATGSATTERMRRLSHASARLHIDTVTLVASQHSPVDAILQAAHARDADIVVVGTHVKSWLGRVLNSSIAAQLVDRARRSVLVTPLDGFTTGVAYASS